MKHHRPYFIVTLVVLPVVILVLMRALSTGNFKQDANKWAQASFTAANVMNSEQVARLGNNLLIIKVGNPGQAATSSDTLSVGADQLLERQYLKIIREHHNPVLIVSRDPGVAAKAWMILSQMGFRELYIKAEKENAEVLKYKFRPDTAGVGKF